MLGGGNYYCNVSKDHDFLRLGLNRIPASLSIRLESFIAGRRTSTTMRQIIRTFVGGS